MLALSVQKKELFNDVQTTTQTKKTIINDKWDVQSMTHTRKQKKVQNLINLYIKRANRQTERYKEQEV